MLPIQLCPQMDFESPIESEPKLDPTAAAALIARANDCLRDFLRKRDQQTAEIGPDGHLPSNAAVTIAGISREMQNEAESGQADLIHGSIPDLQATPDPFLQSLEKQTWLDLSLPSHAKSVISLNLPHPAALAPLDQCILDILWESQQITHTFHGKPGVLLVVLRSAAVYQARIESVSTFISNLPNNFN
jgi:hypothetical protein